MANDGLKSILFDDITIIKTNIVLFCFLIPTNKLMTHYRLIYQHDSYRIKRFLRPVFPKVEEAKDID